MAQGAKANLNIPPFDLTKIHAWPQELLQILNQGIPGHVTDMSRLAPEPRLSFNIITGGYPNTAMEGFAVRIPEDKRWAVVELINSFYYAPEKKKQKKQRGQN